MKIRLPGTLLATTLVAGFSLMAQNRPPEISYSEHADISDPLYLMALRAPRELPTDMKLGNNHGPLLDEVGEGVSVVRGPQSISRLIDRMPGGAAPTVGTQFEGLGTGTPGYAVSLAPPDPVLAVGPNHIFEWVNIHFAIYDKAGTPLLPAPGFLAGNTLWSGFGGPCESTNRGDPIVQYDKTADRWIATQFAFTTVRLGPYAQCVAVSTTGNPLGTYARYSFTYNSLNDYPKLGIWPNAYFIGYNFFRRITLGFQGGVACALDRAAMLAAAPTAAQICFGPTGGPSSNFPADWDGTTPPAGGAAGYFVRTNGTSELQLFRFQPNFLNPPASTFNDGFGGPTFSFVSLPTPTQRPCNGASGACIPQPGTAQLLDTLGDRLMFRTVYRNLGGDDRLVVSHSVDPDGAGAKAAAVRLYEIGAAGSAAPVYLNNVTFSPDATNRWMGSAAMDKQGNIAVGYSVSSAAVNPGLRVTGRLAGDAANTLQAEAVLINGTGSQLTNLSRWGDYSAMQIDPVDDCTFWYAGEYMAANGTFNWRTRVASSKFPGCI
ncbi:MAG: hypothetical protein ACKV2U_24090 [Bryobacteraceae bacterium]